MCSSLGGSMPMLWGRPRFSFLLSPSLWKGSRFTRTSLPREAANWAVARMFSSLSL